MHVFIVIKLNFKITTNYFFRIAQSSTLVTKISIESKSYSFLFIFYVYYAFILVGSTNYGKDVLTQPILKNL